MADASASTIEYISSNRINQTREQNTMITSLENIHASHYPQIARDISTYNGTQDDLEKWLVLNGRSLDSYRSWITFELLISNIDKHLNVSNCMIDCSMFDNLNAIG